MCGGSSEVYKSVVRGTILLLLCQILTSHFASPKIISRKLDGVCLLFSSSQNFKEKEADIVFCGALFPAILAAAPMCAFDSRSCV
jgi:hypothetical protein